MKLRWSILVGQVFLFSVVHWGFQIHLPLFPLFVIVLIGVLSNVHLSLWLRTEPDVREWMIGTILLLDVFLLTGILFFTGGSANPFSFLYLISISLGIVVLNARWMWVMTLVTLSCYGSLFIHWGGAKVHIHDPHHMKMHLEGMWVAYAITTILIVYFVTRMKRALIQQEQALDALHDLQRRSEKIASLAALAGGAVHEFSTPLGTIAIAAKEMEEILEEHPELHELKEDAQLIRQEVEHCKRISQELLLQAGETLGEESLPVRLETLFADTLKDFSDAQRVEVSIESSAQYCSLPLPPGAFVQLLRGLLNNALEASTAEDSIQLKARCTSSDVRIEVHDQGTGISKDVLARLGEPFFTTKAASQGHGLGIFLAKTMMERLGGMIDFETKWGEGTVAALIFPIEQIQLHTEHPDV